MARPRSDIAPRILHAARARFLAQGVDGTSLREVARDAGTNIGMVYYYFSTKEALFLAVVEEVYETFLAGISSALATDVTFEARLERFARRIATMSDDELAILQLVLREGLASDGRRADLLARFRRGHFPLILGTLADGVRTGVLSSEPDLAVLALAFMGVLGAAQVMRRIAASGLPAALTQTSAEEVSAQLVRVLLHGIARKN